MPILVDASLSCNQKCLYCYNKAPRAAQGEIVDLEAVKQTVRRLAEEKKYVVDGQTRYPDITLHGGEPTSWPFFEELLKFSFEFTGRSEIQTNGSLVDERMINLFKKYKTCVGLSYDGDYPLNRFRADRSTSERVKTNLEWLKNEKINVGVIVVISRANGLSEQRASFLRFFDRLHNIKVTGRLNPCFVDGNSPEIELTPEEALDFYLDMANYGLEKGIGGWSPFYDITQKLRGKPAVCIFSGCDVFSSPSGIVVDSRGRLTTCRRGAISYENDMQNMNTRQEILAATDCKDCRYKFACNGGCPSQAIPDWRAKTVWCQTWYRLFDKYERILRSLGEEIKLDEQSQAQGGHGDHWRAVTGEDRPHADEHGDHTEAR